MVFSELHSKNIFKEKEKKKKKRKDTEGPQKSLRSHCRVQLSYGRPFLGAPLFLPRSHHCMMDLTIPSSPHYQKLKKEKKKKEANKRNSLRWHYSLSIHMPHRRIKCILSNKMNLDRRKRKTVSISTVQASMSDSINYEPYDHLMITSHST